MKKYLLAAVCGLFVTAALAQQPVPSAVLLAFQRAQPAADHVKWHSGPTGYEATFMQQPSQRLPGEQRLRGTMLFTPTGDLVEARLDITHNAFPPLGRTALSQQYPRRTIDRIVRITDAQGGVTYETYICKGANKKGQDKDCQTNRFDENGHPLPTAKVSLTP